ncbi:NAD(P)H-dependent oxidoreductase [Paraburkholderia sp. CNPSo 3076]|uniref:NADPH-dependent FMN reductase n=1 Tax=Paraburkholderia sp. CNPSo 3076 TaxID=2940936 RepID=UPI0022548D83|nr:NAD(P)H-dependent oxidoreductase [Paraburkholderia sp. CNPSo 3076]MCX5538302.1 NAD(P)H-dependent oxidoreductase [Paraburkholderia sp. CNPSo 3076]
MNRKTINVIALSGSLRKASTNTALLRAAQEVAPEGMTLEIVGLGDLPFYNEDVEKAGMPVAVVTLSEKIRRADAVLLATPEYNFSFSGVLKNALDWLSRPPGASALAGKPAAIVGAGAGLGTARAQAHLRQVCQALDMLTLNKPEVLVTQTWTRFDAQGQLTDAQTREVLTGFMARFGDWIERLTQADQFTEVEA